MKPKKQVQNAPKKRNQHDPLVTAKNKRLRIARDTKQKELAALKRQRRANVLTARQKWRDGMTPRKQTQAAKAAPDRRQFKTLRDYLIACGQIKTGENHG